ncbi:MAG: GAF domain-containing protein, partial [Candidatus Cybelea sp.]
EKIPGITPQYRGLLLVPVKPRTDQGVIGVLSIDRVKTEEFDDNARNVGSALADLIAFAMSSGDDYMGEISAGKTSGQDAKADLDLQ